MDFIHCSATRSLILGSPALLTHADTPCPAMSFGPPAISVPAGLDPDGLPVGAQLYGNFNSEALLLQLAAQLEAAHPDWFSAKPTIHVGAM